MRILLTLTCILLSSLSAIFSQNVVDPSTITIARDSAGIAHVFAKTDAGAAYGLAWVNSEDAFNVIQETLLAGKGMQGRLKGKEGAAVDFLQHAIMAKDLVNERFDKDLSPEFKKYLQGYCEGINAYATAHPEEILVKKAFPVQPQDVLQAYIIALTALSFAHNEVQAVVEGRYDGPKSPVGSNAYAMNSAKTADGKTYLCINPHWYIDGPLAFYEAHISSEEGLNFTGAGFQGTTSLFMGCNENLGYGMTYDQWDLTDVYRLKMHPKKKLRYRFDGEWKKLEKRPVWLKVKVAGIILPVKMTTYKSVYGATFKSKGKEYFSVRYGSNMTIRSAEQLYRMNKARNFDEFYTALEYQALPRFNIIYGDKYGTIFYIDNAMVPDRKALNYNWKGVLPGDTSATLWKGFVPEKQLPQVKNPECGYVFNTNNTPFNVTCSTSNPDSGDVKRYPKHFDYVPYENNRSERFMEIINSRSTFSFSEFKAIKFDKQMPQKSVFLKSIEPLFNLDASKYPDIAEGIKVIKGWNKRADSTSMEAAFFKASLEYMFDKKKYGYENFFSGAPATEDEFAEGIRKAQEHFMKHFNSLRIPLNSYQYLVRGETAVPLPGFPDVLSASYTEKYKDGKTKCMVTDGFTQFVIFGKNGAEHIESMIPYGPSSKPGSPHYTSSMKNFSAQKTKHRSLNKEEILRTAVKIYTPGK
jgi:acyl-homoserine-lactone acylase